MAGSLAVAILLTSAGCPASTPRRPLAPLPVDAYAHYLRGRAAFFEADYASALVELDLAVAAAPDQAGIAIARAQAMSRLGRRVEAVDAIATVVARWPGSPEAWLAAGQLRTGAAETRAAIDAFRRAIALDGELTSAYLGLAEAQTRAGQTAAAEATYRALVRRLPAEAEGYWRLAQLELARDDDRAAEASLRRTVELAPGELEPRRALAALLARTDRLDDALAVERRAFDRSGADLAVGEDLVWLLLEAGDRRGAIDVLELYDDGALVGDQARAAAMLVAIGEPARGLRVARAAARRGAEVGAIIARAHLVAGALVQAVVAAGRVPADDASWVEAQTIAAEAELAAGALDAAATRLDAANVRVPDSLELVRLGAELRRRRGDLAGARARYLAAARRAPRSAALALAWSSFEASTGDHARALALAEKVLSATPDDPVALDQVGFTLVEAGGDRARARTLLARARRLAPGDASLLDSWGWLLRADGDRDGAGHALTRAAAMAPYDPEIVGHAATVAVERGHHARAGRMLAAIADLPMSPELSAQVAATIARTGIDPCYARDLMSMSWLARVVVGSVLVTAACKETPSKDQCEKLLAHLIDIETSSGGTDKVPDEMKADLEKQKKAIREYAVGQKFIETCTHRTPKKVVKCGIEAKNADELARCDQ